MVILLFSPITMPLRKGRPNESDLDAAANFAKELREIKLTT